MSTGEANAQLSMSHIAVEDPGKTLGAHTFNCETWYRLLRVTSPAPGGHTWADPQHLSSAQVPQHWPLGSVTG